MMAEQLNKKVKNYQFKIDKGVSIFLIGILVFTFFNELITAFITNTIIDIFFKGFNSSMLKDILLIISVILISILFYLPRLKKKYIASKNITLAIFFIAICYSYYRFINSIWYIFPFELCTSIKYLDIIYLFAFLNTLLFSVSLYKGWRINSEKAKRLYNEFFHEEASIFNTETDDLKYKNYASMVADTINNNTTKKSLAFGINGQWGIGKSSFLNLTKTFLDKKTLIVEFNPWPANSTSAVIDIFFSVLQKSIGVYHSSLNKKLIEYSIKLTEINDSTLTKIINTLFLRRFVNPSISELYDQINRALEEVDMKLVVVIDDLDRMDRKEIIQILKLIRNTANFYNTYYIVAYDRNYVINAISELNSYNPQSYLEKIFQLELTLPYFDKSIFSKHLLKLIKVRVNNKLHNEIEKAILGGGLTKTNHFDEWLSTMRDSIRLANAVCLNYKRLENEVYFPDFINMQLIRLKHPNIYELLFRKTNDFLETGPSEVITSFYDRNKKREIYNLKKNSKHGDQQLHKYALSKELRDNSKKYLITEPEIERLITLLETIFIDKNDNRLYNVNPNPKSVVFPNNFRRYFAYYVLEDDLSEVEFGNSLKSPLDVFLAKISLWVEKGLGNILRIRFEEIDRFDSKEGFERVMTAIFYLARQKHKGLNFTTIGFDVSNIELKLRTQLNLYSDATQLTSFFEKLLKSSSRPPLFDCALLTTWLDKKWSNDLPIQKRQAQSILYYYLESYSSKISKLDEMFWILFHSCRRKIIEEDHDYDKTFFESVRTFAKDFIIKRDLKGFLNNVVSPDDPASPKRYFISTNAVFTICENLEDFKIFIDSIHNNDEFFVEFKSFFKKCEDAKFNYVEFNFNFLFSK
jgi:hypothetical protein